ncbi:trypsin-like peptidase domain-containing protein [Streptomyces sp. NPDC001941]|uniref:VMAP-C domain-containing protein n=1 Tax=Streptomyces sp. NPDC001941 TaxID=3154659 RepID=UPI00331BFCFB
MHPATALTALQGLLEDCRVRVSGPTHGTGFFVAPGLVVTCAHVAGATAGAEVPVHWRGREHAGVVLAASPAPAGPRGLWPFPDLAVVRVPEVAGHPCVWLEDSEPPSGSEVTVVGYSDVYGQGLSERTAELTRRGSEGPHGARMTGLVGGEVNRGLSGGPALNHGTGGVFAVVKATRKPDSTMGGVGTPVGALRLLDADVYRELVRAHDLFHAGDPRWAVLADRVRRPEEDGPYDLTRAESRHLLALIAELRDRGHPTGHGGSPPPGPAPGHPGDASAAPGPPADPGPSHAAAFLAVAAPGTPPPDRFPLLDHRDVFTELGAREPAGPGRLPYALAYAADLARRHDARALRHRVLITAGRLGLGDEAERLLRRGPVEAPLPSVIARIRHSLRDRSLYHVTVWRYLSQGDIAPAAAQSPALPLAAAFEHLAALLPEQIDLMGGVARPGLVELILPAEALDVDVAQWRLWPQSWFALGRKQNVVVRPLERHEAPTLHAAWAERWEHLDGKGVGGALVCVCGRDRQGQEVLGASFDSDPSLAALALAGSPHEDPVSSAYQVAVASGVPLMVWRHGGGAPAREDGGVCGLPGRHACPGDSFYSGVCSALTDATRDELPDRIRHLRVEAVKAAACGDEDGDAHVGGRVVLLWDDPRRRIPGAPLRTAAGTTAGTEGAQDE